MEVWSPSLAGMWRIKVKPRKDALSLHGMHAVSKRTIQNLRTLLEDRSRYASLKIVIN